PRATAGLPPFVGIGSDQPRCKFGRRQISAAGIALSDVRSRKFMQSLQIGVRRLASSRSPCQDPLVTASDEFAGLAFGARIEDYAKFRLAYPPALFDAIDAALAPGLRRFAVDLGSGTGLSTAQLLGRFSRVAAVEPDPRMAAQIVPRPGLDVIVAKAEE